MQELNVKEKLQELINYWIGKIRDFENDLNKLDHNSKEFQTTARMQAVFKGRIYAARSFADVLGFEFDTDYLTI
jgi:hypothetical protein